MAASLASADEIRSLLQRAAALLGDSPLYAPEDDVFGHNTRIEAATHAILFCANAAVLLNDLSLAAPLAEAVELLTFFDDRPHGTYVASAAFGVRHLLEKGAPVGEDIESLAGCDDPRARRAVASGLRPRDERAIRLLERLADDAEQDVRTAARATLAKVREVAWWRGKFSRDPAATLAPEEAAKHKETFERLSALLDERTWSDEPPAEVVELASTLPDALALDAGVTYLAGRRRRSADTAVAFGAMVLGRDGGGAAMTRVLEAWCATRIASPGTLLTKMLQALPAERRLAPCLDLLAFVARGSRGDPDESTYRDPAFIAASALAAAWPEGGDVTPLVEVVLALPIDGRSDKLARDLARALQSAGVDATQVFDRVIEARLAGYPDAWRRVCWSMDALLRRAPVPALRPAAERAILDGDPDTRRWGFEALLGRAYDPSRDPPQATLVEQLCEAPDARRIFAESFDLVPLALPLLREDLRRGRLAFFQATRVMRAIERLYGAASEEDRAARRKELEAFLGPPHLQVPATADEWRALREARAAAPRDLQFWWSALGTLPPGPWDPEDRTLLEEAMGAAEEEPKIVDSIAEALSEKPDAGLLPLFDTLLPLADDESARRRFHRFRERTYRALGLAVVEEGERESKGDEGEVAELAWMDEPEE